MKILLVSISSPHFFGWITQLKNSGHELFWFDVNGSGEKIERIGFSQQNTDWKHRFDFPGRYRLKQVPVISSLIKKINERNFEKSFQDYLNIVKPDLVHSFVMYLGAAPIHPVMKNYPKVKWLYSSWGSDLFYYRNNPHEKASMEKVLPRIHYLFTDCKRDYIIAKNHGFKGQFLGVFPGAGGVDFQSYKDKILSFDNRNVIAVKGYQGKHGRCIEILKALKIARKSFDQFKIIVFGASTEVFNFVETENLFRELALEVYGIIPQEEVMGIFGRSLLYIGNSTSDGIPNTLLEAICMQAFPIQSNPGGATAELIADGKNGFLIEEPKDSEYLASLLIKAIRNNVLIKNGVEYNKLALVPKFERKKVQNGILNAYKEIETDLQ